MNIFFLGLLLSFFHPYYISLTEIKQAVPGGTIDLSCRIFTDDLENSLRKISRITVDLSEPVHRNEAERALAQYLENHVTVLIDGKPQHFRFIGYEIEQDAAWIYMQLKNTPKNYRHIHVHNIILYEQHPEQINLLKMDIQGNKKSIKLENPQSEADFSL